MDAREGYIRAEDRTEQAPPGKRWRSSFEWELVEPELLRELIAALPDGRAAVADIDDPELLLEVARRVFGTQLPKRAMPRLAPVLLERWLPGAREDTLARLANITQTALGKAYADQVYRDAREPDQLPAGPQEDQELPREPARRVPPRAPRILADPEGAVRRGRSGRLRAARRRR